MDKQELDEFDKDIAKLAIQIDDPVARSILVLARGEPRETNALHKIAQSLPTVWPSAK